MKLSIHSWSHRYIAEETNHSLSDLQRKEIQDAILSRLQRYVPELTEAQIKENIDFDCFFQYADDISHSPEDSSK